MCVVLLYMHACTVTVEPMWTPLLNLISVLCPNDVQDTSLNNTLFLSIHVYTIGNTVYVAAGV